MNWALKTIKIRSKPQSLWYLGNLEIYSDFEYQKVGQISCNFLDILSVEITYSIV